LSQFNALLGLHPLKGNRMHCNSLQGTVFIEHI
jgi:hypothetical protein